MVTLIGFMFMCFQICGFIPSATVEWISEQEVPYATYGSSWVGYDNMRSYSAKVTTTICNSNNVIGGAIIDPQTAVCNSSILVCIFINSIYFLLIWSYLFSFYKCCGRSVGLVDECQQPGRRSCVDYGHGWLWWILLLSWNLPSHQPPEDDNG